MEIVVVKKELNEVVCRMEGTLKERGIIINKGYEIYYVKKAVLRREDGKLYLVNSARAEGDESE